MSSRYSRCDYYSDRYSTSDNRYPPPRESRWIYSDSHRDRSPIERPPVDSQLDREYELFLNSLEQDRCYRDAQSINEQYVVMDEWTDEAETEETMKQASEPSEEKPSVQNRTFVVNTDICQEISGLLSGRVTADQSKPTPADYSLTFAEADFHLKPPKLDDWMIERARQKLVFRFVNASEEQMVKTQDKILDIGYPLLSLYAKLDDPDSMADVPTLTGEMKSGLQAALQQWGQAVSHVSKARREAIIQLTEPKYSYLLQDQSALPAGKEARELLFTSKFVDVLLKEKARGPIPKKSEQVTNPVKENGWTGRSRLRRDVPDQPSGSSFNPHGNGQHTIDLRYMSSFEFFDFSYSYC